MSEVELIDRYIEALSRDPKAEAPPGLDAEMAAFVRQLALAERMPPPEHDVQSRVWLHALTGAQRGSNTLSASASGWIDPQVQSSRVEDYEMSTYTGAWPRPGRKYSGAPIALLAAMFALVFSAVLVINASQSGSGSFLGFFQQSDEDAQGDTLSVFDGHEKHVLSANFSPDGKTILSAGGNVTSGTVQSSIPGDLLLWDIATGEILQRFEGHRGGVTQAVFSPDGQLALSASADETLILWDVATGEIIHQLEGHTQPLFFAAAFSPDGQTVLSGAMDADLILWDVATGDIIRRFEGYVGEGHRGWVMDIAYSPDGQTALSASSDETLILWELETGEVIRSFEGHSWWVNGVAFSPDGETALSASSDIHVILWDVATGQELRTLRGHGAIVLDVAYSPDGQTALSGDRLGNLILWDLATGEELHRFEGHTDEVLGVSFSPDGETALSASRDGTVRLWSLSDWQPSG